MCPYSETAMRRPALPQVVIPVPCHADWNAMPAISSDGRARMCGACDTPVYDGTSLTRRELERLISTVEGRRLPCLRLHRRPDGTIVTRDCFEPLRRVGHYVWLKVAVLAVGFWTEVWGLAFGRRLEWPAFTNGSGGRDPGDIPALRGRSMVLGGIKMVRKAEPAPDWLRRRAGPPTPATDSAPPLQRLEVDEELVEEMR